MGVHFGPGLTSSASLATLARREKLVKTLISRAFQKRESRGRYSVYTSICTIFCTHLCGDGAQNDDFGVPSKNQEFPKRDPWREQVRPKRHKTGGAKKSVQRFVGAVSAMRKTDNGGETEPFSKAVHVAFAQGLLVFFERSIGDRTPKRELSGLLFLSHFIKKGSILGPLFFHLRPLGSQKGRPRI